ncbi:hypothetical protein PA598K_03855 [Paenibacillus sp. 598K]|uniref:hypothetical protein n=1 Tax=Paenibacillus sp. 598K TaxID=1117987 RepID=UPI000FF9CB18|nr:hypothetical protein [Paenibacillus sp. 598K]GBF75443.1 hypothetical protein PA598K_03855 [Paenibacillus sp. 598K]
MRDERDEDGWAKDVLPKKRRRAQAKREKQEAELSAELSADVVSTVHSGEMDRADATAGRVIGWVALAFAVASWFLWPVLMGATAALLGWFAYRQGSKRLGAWAVGIGLVALAAYLALLPLYYYTLS